MADRKKVLTQLAELSICLDMSGYHNDAQCVRDALAMLREQEPVKPIKTPENIRAEYNCGKCTASVGIRFHDGDWYFKADYCPRCGREVKWDA